MLLLFANCIIPASFLRQLVIQSKRVAMNFDSIFMNFSCSLEIFCCWIWSGWYSSSPNVLTLYLYSFYSKCIRQIISEPEPLNSSIKSKFCLLWAKNFKAMHIFVIYSTSLMKVNQFSSFNFSSIDWSTQWFTLSRSSIINGDLCINSMKISMGRLSSSSSESTLSSQIYLLNFWSFYFFSLDIL